MKWKPKNMNKTLFWPVAFAKVYPRETFFDQGRTQKFIPFYPLLTFKVGLEENSKRRLRGKNV